MPTRTATLSAAPEPIIDPAPELFPLERVDWRRARRVLLRTGVLALPIAGTWYVQWAGLTWQAAVHWLLMAVLWAAVGAVVLMVLTIVATLVVKVMRALSGVGRWLIR